MAGLKWRQAKLLKKQIKKIYGRSYIPLRTGDSTITIGDVLRRRKDTLELIDSKVLGIKEEDLNQGSLIDRIVTSDDSVDFSFKAKGVIDKLGLFKENELGLMVNFSSKNQMFLIAKGTRQISLKDFTIARDLIIQKYVDGDIRARAIFVRGLVYADKYYLAYSGKSGGNVGLSFETSIPVISENTKIDANFTTKWSDSIGYYIDAKEGGPLAYRASTIHCRRHLRSKKVQDLILNKGYSELEALDALNKDERKELMNTGALDLMDSTSLIMEEIDEIKL